MKRIILTAFSLLAAIGAFAQSAQPATPATFIKGDMNIKFNTRTQTDSDGKPREGVQDKYTLTINVSNNIQFRGLILHTPYIAKTIGASQQGKLDFTVETDALKPSDPSVSKNVGRIFGTVPIDDKNVYRFADGNLKQVVFPIGTAKGFESVAKGLALGKPPAASEGVFSKLKKEALNISKMVGGKQVSIAVTKYDKMEFQQTVLPAGPVQVYPEVQISGNMIYDYGRTAWYFENFTVSYALDGRQYFDKITGNIRWIESPNRASNGEGEYQFDVRVNEPPATEAAVFSGPSDESAFFATDDAMPALTGTMKYKDTLSGETAVASNVTVDLRGNKLSKAQTVYLAKIILFAVTVPLNAD